MFSLLCLLALCAFGAAVLSLMGRCPLSVPVLLLSIVEVLRCIPLR